MSIRPSPRTIVFWLFSHEYAASVNIHSIFLYLLVHFFIDVFIDSFSCLIFIHVSIDLYIYTDIYSLHLGVHNICYTNLSQQSRKHLLWVAEWRPPRPHCAVPCRCLQCLGANGNNPPGKWGNVPAIFDYQRVGFRFENHAKYPLVI
jgi:hypothetical protein